MSHAATKVRLEDLDIKPYMIAKLKMAGIQSVFDLAISIPHQLVDNEGGMLTGTGDHYQTDSVKVCPYTSSLNVLLAIRGSIRTMEKKTDVC